MGRLVDVLLTVSGVKAARESIARDHGVARTIIAETKGVVKRPPSKGNEEASSFEQRVREAGLGESDLKRQYRQLAVQAWLFYGIGGLTGLLCGYFIGSGSLTGLFACLGLAPMFLALGARSAFYAWHLRERRFGAFAEWMGKPHEWWPLRTV